MVRKTSTFDQVLDEVEKLTDEQQSGLVQIVRRRLAARGRKRVIRSVEEGLAQYKRGEGKVATVDEIMREIQS